MGLSYFKNGCITGQSVFLFYRFVLLENRTFIFTHSRYDYVGRSNYIVSNIVGFFFIARVDAMSQLLIGTISIVSSPLP